MCIHCCYLNSITINRWALTNLYNLPMKTWTVEFFCGWGYKEHFQYMDRPLEADVFCIPPVSWQHQGDCKIVKKNQCNWGLICKYCNTQKYIEKIRQKTSTVNMVPTETNPQRYIFYIYIFYIISIFYFFSV